MFKHAGRRYFLVQLSLTESCLITFGKIFNTKLGLLNQHQQIHHYF